jgi:hypothetical protein
LRFKPGAGRVCRAEQDGTAEWSAAHDDPVKPVERNLVARASGVDEASPCVAPATRALSASALEEGGDVGAVALDGAA